MAEMPLAEHNNMVKAIPSNRTDEPLRISVLPWRPWRDRSISYAHCAEPFEDDIAIDAISIANDVPWRLLPTVSLGQLTGDPIGTWAYGHTPATEGASNTPRSHMIERGKHQPVSRTPIASGICAAAR